MQGPSWIALFNRIPPRLHDSVALTLVTGAEILMQSILRLESDFAIMRGRMAGSTDAGRVIVLPYNQIINLAFTKRMLQPEVEAIFGKATEPGTAPIGETPSQEEKSEAAGTLIEAVESAEETPNQGVAIQMRTVLNIPPPPSQTAGKNQPPPPSKSILLARLRARLAEQEK